LALSLDPFENWEIPPARHAEMWEQMASAYERQGSEEEPVSEWFATMAELCHAVARVVTHLAELTPSSSLQVADEPDTR
jgi:hypothetical protein